MSDEMMRAVVIKAHGSVEGLEIAEVVRPRVTNPTDVLVRVHAAGINRADLLQRRGLYPAPPDAPQDIPGLEFAGEVIATGADIGRWWTGQRVFGIAAGGAQAEYILAHEEMLVEIPSNLDYAQAAAVPEVFTTAHDALFSQAMLQRGENVLLHAAGSGVALAATQLARAAGAKVFGTSRTPNKIERAKEYGLNDGVVVADDPTVFAHSVKEWTNDAGVEVILDLVGGAYLAANIAALARRGRMIFVGTTAGAQASFDIGAVMRKRLHLIGTVLRSRPLEEKIRAARRFARHVIPLLARGEVRPVVDRVFPLTEVRAAHERMESNETFGKLILTL